MYKKEKWTVFTEYFLYNSSTIISLSSTERKKTLKVISMYIAGVEL